MTGVQTCALPISGALCNLTTTDPTVTIHDKNDIPFDKVDNKESVDVGEIVTYPCFSASEGGIYTFFRPTL